MSGARHCSLPRPAVPPSAAAWQVAALPGLPPTERTMYSKTKKSSSFSRITSLSCTMQGWCSLRRLRTCGGGNNRMGAGAHELRACSGSALCAAPVTTCGGRASGHATFLQPDSQRRPWHCPQRLSHATHLAQRQALVPAVELALHALDGHHLARLPVGGLEHAAVCAVAQLRGDAVALHGGGRWAGGGLAGGGAGRGWWAGEGGAPPRCSCRCRGALGGRAAG